jgi:transcription-repair coupling factor (superfamily II helicase)
MQHNSHLFPNEHLPFILKERTQKEKIVFISQNHSFLEHIYNNLHFLNVEADILSPRFTPHINHHALDDHTFLKHYIQSFEEQKSVTLLHSALLALPMPMPDLYGSLKIETGQNISITEIAKTLADFGYTSCATVHNPAEFALRGYIIDFATTQQNIRIEFAGNRIESIKLFDEETQRSLENISFTIIYPNKFLLPSFCEKEKFQARYQIAFQEPNPELYTMIEHHPESCDINKYTKLLTKQTINILEIYEGEILLHNMTAEYITEQKEVQFFEKQHNIPHGALYFTPSELTATLQKKDVETISTL